MSIDFSKLSPKEIKICDMLCEGATAKDMAQVFKCAPRTVKAQKNKIFLKLRIEGGLKMVKLAKLYQQYKGLMNTHDAKLNAIEVFKPKHLQIMEYVSEGYSVREIALLMGNSDYVIKNYLRILYDVTGSCNRIELMNWYEAHKETLHGMPTPHNKEMQEMLQV